MEKPSTARIALKWGLIFAIISVVITTVSYVTGLWTKTWILFLAGTATSILMQYLAMNEFKKLNEGYMTYSQGLGIGLLTTATSSVVGIIYDTIYQKFVDPQILVKKMEMTEDQYKQFGMSETQIADALEKAERWNNSGITFVFGILIVIIIGFILSLIISAILKKDKPVFA